MPRPLFLLPEIRKMAGNTIINYQENNVYRILGFEERGASRFKLGPRMSR